MKKVAINSFSGGIVNDPRTPSSNVARVVSNFDILTDSYRMTPYRDSESGATNGANIKLQNFCIAHWLPGATNVYNLFALGVKSGAGTARVYYKKLTTGSDCDLDDGGWEYPNDGESASGETNFNLFVYYKRTGLIYGAKAGTHIWAFDPTNGGAFAETHQALTYTNISQGIVHSKDDILYIPYDNIIAKNNNGAWTTAALTLPTHLYITSICEYGNYLAIACAPLSGVGNSVVYLWDRDSTITTLSDTIDWGQGNIRVIEEIGGYLVGISISGNSSTRFKNKVFFRYYAGTGGSQGFMTLQDEKTGTQITQLAIAKQKLDNRVYFLMSIYKNGVQRDGVWSIGKESQGFVLVHELLPNNDTSILASGLKNFFFVDDFCFISYVNAAGAYALSKTNDQSSYTATSIWESTINPNMPLQDRVSKKQLNSVAVHYEPLPAGGQVILYYRVDGGSWTEVFTETTDSAVVTEMTKAASANFTSGREYEFQIKSTGGAVITGLEYTYEPLETLL